MDYKLHSKNVNITPSSSTDSLPLLPVHDPHATSFDTTHNQAWNSKSSIRFPNSARDFFDRNKGLFLIACSQLFGSGMVCIVKLMSSADNEASTRVPTFELIGIRMALTWICATSWMLYNKVPHPILGPPDIRKWLIIRGVSGFFGIFGIYFSVQYLSLSDATVITFLSPFVTAFLGCFLLHESFSLKEACAGIASFIGVILIARPTFLFPTHHSHSMPPPIHGMSTANSTHHGNLMGDEVLIDTATPAEGHSEAMRIIAVGVALLGVLGAAGAYTSLRRIGNHAHMLHSVCYLCAWSVFVSIIGSIVMKVQWAMPSNWLWGLGLIAIVVLGFGGQTLLTLGLRYETAGRGTLALYVQISKPREKPSHKHPQMRANITSSVSERDVSLGAPAEMVHLMSIHHRNDVHVEQQNVGEDDSWMEVEREKSETKS
ncbi:hypothetical protein FRC02_003368 [Tulasnella sp. 418]|nr:hypothetical protein FRC02_003368 [Tulasnella sp. 418]